MKVSVYVHGSKDTCYEAGEQAGLDEEQLKRFVYAANEHLIDYYVDEDGNATAIALDGIELRRPE